MEEYPRVAMLWLMGARSPSRTKQGVFKVISVWYNQKHEDVILPRPPSSSPAALCCLLFTPNTQRRPAPPAGQRGQNYFNDVKVKWSKAEYAVLFTVCFLPALRVAFCVLGDVNFSVLPWKEIGKRQLHYIAFIKNQKYFVKNEK